MDDFLQKLKKMVRIVLYGPTISQSDCRKAGPYQLPIIKGSTTFVSKNTSNKLIISFTNISNENG